MVDVADAKTDPNADTIRSRIGLPADPNHGLGQAVRQGAEAFTAPSHR